MREDYSVMWWTGDGFPWTEGGGEWTDDATQRYATGEYDGVFYRHEGSVAQPNIDFLKELSGLRYVKVDGRVTDDTAAFRLPELEELVLTTRSKRALPSEFPAQRRLRELVLHMRPNLEAIRGMPSLRRLVLFRWSGKDLEFLGDKPALERLDIEGINRPFSLAGIEGCTAITELEVTQSQCYSVSPLRSLTSLRRMWLIGGGRVPEGDGLDLSDLQGLEHLEEMRLTFGRVRSLAPIVSFPKLRELRLRATEVADGDLTPLDRLPSTTKVRGPND